MGEYANAVVYKITTSDSIYVGSAKNFAKRKKKHKYNLYNEKGEHYNLKVYRGIRANNYQWEMVVIKDFPCESEAELVFEEQRYIDELKPDLNSKNSYTNKREYTKKYCAEYRQKNKEKLKKASANYWLENKEEINKHKREKIECECGCIVRRGDLPRHKKTQRHLDWEQNIVKIPHDRSEKIECECGCIVTRHCIVRHKKTKKHLDLMILKNT